MSLEQDIHLLADVALFSDFTDDQLRLVAFGSEKLIFPAGTQIFYQGQSSDGGYLIVDGEVELWVDHEGNRKTLGTYGRGDMIGEMAVLTRNTRAASAMTVTECSLIRVSRATMTRVLEEYPELAALLHDRICDNVISFSENLEPVRRRFFEGE